MLGKAKKALRVTHTALDEEINDLIEAAKYDMKISGVVKQDEKDPLIIRAIITYCKANFGYDNADSEKLKASYESLKSHLSLCGEYNAL